MKQSSGSSKSTSKRKYSVVYPFERGDTLATKRYFSWAWLFFTTLFAAVTLAFVIGVTATSIFTFLPPLTIALTTCGLTFFTMLNLVGALILNPDIAHNGPFYPDFLSPKPVDNPLFLSNLNKHKIYKKSDKTDSLLMGTSHPNKNSRALKKQRGKSSATHSRSHLFSSQSSSDNLLHEDVQNTSGNKL